jgi:hypothetical protein
VQPTPSTRDGKKNCVKKFSFFFIEQIVIVAQFSFEETLLTF